jgi:hypothetical protein
MSNVRWQPLPIDEQVVAAIEDRKEKFIKSYSGGHGDPTADPQEQWIFNHICTVLDHAKKIFEMSEKELCNPTKKDTFKE